ncbi:hypothetical protein LTR56_023270 [Elasticomyces elasticus]|nr:hypothetical protein LTR56_023270 [Elasticomyces elasticus]KAK3624169.1 hypothetical protein LTR22_024074 [Elasticomyces elasticus]KAK4906375.1 hypothetical protein LTR49_024456 [Elasticomyces elasticus]KAK5744640.1 hypothetical protein LTS12_023415 [Elasticomyces elasticus]
MAKESVPAVSDEGFFMSIIDQLGVSNIDWQKVADKNGIVTKGAANKRFYRMKLKYEKETGVKMGGGGASPTKGGGASPSKAGTPAAEGEEAIVKEKPAAAKKKAAGKKGGKKRKAAEQEEDEEEGEEGSKRVKGEVDGEED